MDIVVSVIKNAASIIWNFFKFLIMLPIRFTNVFVIFMGIFSTAFLLWWIFSVPQPTDNPSLKPGT
jgi:hypothetical protein